MNPTAQILLWLGVLIAVVAVIVVVAVALRRRYRRTIDLQPEPFTFAQLRALRDAGQLTEAEYVRAKAVLVAQTRALLDGPSDKAASGPQSPGMPGGADEPDNRA